MLAVWRGGAFKRRMLYFIRKGALPRGQCVSSPQQLRRHSPKDQQTVKASIGVKSINKEGMTGDDLVERNEPPQEEVWAKLVGRANEERIFINGHPVSALLDTGSQVTHVSHDFCLANGIQINSITQLVNIEGTGGHHWIFRICWT